MTIATCEKKVDKLLALFEAQFKQPPLVAAVPLWSADLIKMPWESKLHQQEFVQDSGRIALVNVGGRNAVRLETRPGDNLYAGPDVERCDLLLPQEHTDGYEGREQWWAHSVWFPNDFICPSNIWGVAFDFHTASDPVGLQSNFHLDFSRWDGEVLRFRGYAEGNVDSKKPTYEKVIGLIKRNFWHDFIYHVKWTSGSSGFFDAWANEERILSYKGPTLYANDGVYAKFANYHQAHGKASAIIHSRMMRGAIWQAITAVQPKGV